MFGEISVFYRGLVLGLMIAAPVGPVGLLCIRRTIQKGVFIGLATGLGAACADTLFGAAAAFGVAAILDFIKHYGDIIRMLGGTFLLVMAWHTWHDKPKPSKRVVALAGHILRQSRPSDANFVSIIKALGTGLFITLTNPVTMVAILAVVATFGNMKKNVDAATIVAGLFTGSTLWWVTLSGGIALVRNHFTESRIMVINRITSVALAILAVWAFATGLHWYLTHSGAGL